MCCRKSVGAAKGYTPTHSAGDIACVWETFWYLYESGRPERPDSAWVGWEANTHKILKQRLRPGDLFVDVGAWIGPVSRWALELGAYVVAVEPDPVAASEFRRTMPEVELWEGALGVVGGWVNLAANPAPDGAYGDSESRIGESGIAVRAWPVEEILGGRSPALVKVDVEGYEAELLRHPSSLLSAPCPILVSLHGRLVDDADGYWRTLREALSGYKLLLPDDGSEIKVDRLAWDCIEILIDWPRT